MKSGNDIMIIDRQQQPANQNPAPAEGLANQNPQQPGERLTKTTSKFMSRHERAKILGVRAAQISVGAPLMVEVESGMNPMDMAVKELNEGKSPFIVRRIFPDGSYEDWPVHELRQNTRYM